jgi:benzoyl-CoA 2,3-epoxidase subunit A
MDQSEIAVIRQHLIDPEICIRCNTCEATCPVGAITHDARNYVVDVEKCNSCMACIPPCPTGSIDNWCTVLVCRHAAGLGRVAAGTERRGTGRGRPHDG